MIAEQFEKEKIDADIRTVYLDCESYWEEPELERMRFLVDSVSRDWRPEVILVNEDQATYSLMKCGVQLGKEVPVVFGGVNYPNWGLLKRHPNVTGFHDKIAFNEKSVWQKSFSVNTSVCLPCSIPPISTDKSEEMQRNSLKVIK